MLERVRLNNKNSPRKQRGFVRTKPPQSNSSTKSTFALPPELHFDLDRRSQPAKLLYRRLCGYVRELTNDGKRALRPAEVPRLQQIVLMEQRIDEQFHRHARRLDPEELKGICSEHRRQLGALGLDAAAPESAPSPPPSQEPAASGDDGFLKTFLDGVEALSQAIRNEKEQAVTPAREKSRRRKPRRVRRQHRPAPKTTVDDDEEIKSGVRRNGAWFPSDM